MKFSPFPRFHGGNPEGNPRPEVKCRRCGIQMPKPEAILAHRPSGGRVYYCPDCHEKRESGVKPEYSTPPRVNAPPITKREAEWLNSYQDDYWIIDENGVEVLASKLAKRYRAEMMRQKAGDYAKG